MRALLLSKSCLMRTPQVRECVISVQALGSYANAGASEARCLVAVDRSNRCELSWSSTSLAYQLARDCTGDSLAASVTRLCDCRAGTLSILSLRNAASVSAVFPLVCNEAGSGRGSTESRARRVTCASVECAGREEA